MAHDRPRGAIAVGSADFAREALGFAEHKRKGCGQRPEAYGELHDLRGTVIVQQTGLGYEQDLLLRHVADERLRENLGWPQYPEHQPTDGQGPAAGPFGQYSQGKQHLDDASKRLFVLLLVHLHAFDLQRALSGRFSGG